MNIQYLFSSSHRSTTVCKKFYTYPHHSPFRSSPNPIFPFQIMTSLSLAVAATVASDLTVPRVFPHLNYDFVNAHVNQTSPLALTLDKCDIHMHSVAHNLGALDVDVAATIWATIRHIGRTIILAANPGMPTSEIKPFIPAARLTEIEMPTPVIIQAYTFTQNPCHLIGTPEDIISRFQHIQNIGIEGLQWLMHARARCAIDDNNWEWSTSPTETFAAHPALTSGPIPASSDRLLELFQAENTERAVIVHPTMSNSARAIRAAANISLPDDDLYEPFYPTFEAEVDEEYSPQSPILFDSPTPYNSSESTSSDRAAHGSDSGYSNGSFTRSVSPLQDVAMCNFAGVNYIDRSNKEIIDLTYDSDEDSLMSDE